jgi:hypothetical protein
VTPLGARNNTPSAVETRISRELEVGTGRSMSPRCEYQRDYGRAACDRECQHAVGAAGWQRMTGHCDPTVVFFDKIRAYSRNTNRSGCAALSSWYRLAARG